jgi:hypothetical protein
VVCDHGVPASHLHEVDRLADPLRQRPRLAGEVHADQESRSERLGGVRDDQPSRLGPLTEHRRRRIEREPAQIVPVDPQALDERTWRPFGADECDGAVEVPRLVAVAH